MAGTTVGLSNRVFLHCCDKPAVPPSVLRSLEFSSVKGRLRFV